MKTYRQVTIDAVDDITCDRCGRSDDEDGMEGQEFLQHDMSCGFGSVFGDLNHINLDLCQHCVKELLGEWVRVSRPGDEP